jgi:TldD protein
MSPSRRDFIKTTAATAAALTAGGRFILEPSAQTLPAPGADPAAIAIANDALNAARAAGASYADVRIGRYRRQTIATRERQVSGVNDSESYGLGVRTLVNGCWGFAATSAMTRAGAQAAALEAVGMSKAARAVQKHRVELAPVTPVTGTWITPVTRDPLEVPLEDKIALLLAANAAAMRVKNVRFVNSSLSLLRSEDTRHVRGHQRDADDDSSTAFRRRRSTAAIQAYEEEPEPRRRVEYVESLNMPAMPSSGRRSRPKSYRQSVEPGYDLILEPTNLWLTIHESIGHATELDRAIGEEANYAGTSFVAPPEKMIGQLRYGPAIMNIQADRTQDGSLSRVAWDDEGVPADQWLLVDKGVFKDYQTTREQVARSRSDWCRQVARLLVCRVVDAVQFQRMNVSLLPETKTSVRCDRGRDRPWHRDQESRLVTIDHQRYNFQFGQAFYEATGGRLWECSVTSPIRAIRPCSGTPWT